MDYKIYVTYHKDELVGEYKLRNDDHHILFASHKIPEGVNINHLNSVFSEMVTMFYVWKNNLKADYIGFEHYRRHLNIVRMPKKDEIQVFRILDFKDTTVYEQYAKCHNASDMDIMLDILDKKYGADNVYSSYIKNSHRLIANCTFLTNCENFCALCEFMFPLLEEYGNHFGMYEGYGSKDDWETKTMKDFNNQNVEYQTRVVSFLAERLISAWIINNLKYYNGIDVAIVHYNTPKMTEATIRSLEKVCPGCHVVIFDNSDIKPFTKEFYNVEIIDNTKGQIVDFDKMLSRFPKREIYDRNKSNFGSAKHCRSVDVLFRYLPDGFVLMDSDILVFKDIKDFVDTKKAIIGHENRKEGVLLIDPFICWLNVPMLRKNKIKYFNGTKMWALSDKKPNNRYDTGAWVFEEVRKKRLPWSGMDIWNYIVHFGHGSWREKNSMKWLDEHRNLYI